MNEHKGNVGRVLKYLKTHTGITSMKSFELFGATRLSAIIYLLRKDGYEIKSVNKFGKNRYGDKVNFVEYRLNKK